MASLRNTPGLEASVISLGSVENDTSAPSSAVIDTQQSRWTSASTPMTASPSQSRDVSPARTPKFAGRTSRPSLSPVQSRKNSAQDPSPPRTRSSAHTFSSTPRQLSTTAIPNLPPPSGADTIQRAPTPQQQLAMAQDTSKDAPRWPISPRLKSPAPAFSRPTIASSARRSDSELPTVNVQRATPSPHVETNVQPVSDIEAEELHLPSGMKTPTRGSTTTLETVQEASQPNTPRPGLDAAIKKLEKTASLQKTGGDMLSDATDYSIASSQNESGSDSGSVKTNTRRSSFTAPPPPLHNRESSSTLRFSGRGQASGESSSRNMTVETEMVQDMPRLSLIPNAGGQRVNGSLRTRPSNETIKPRKEKKRHTRKATSGTASSKADIFEAKVASAVEEADSSDSDETFVYDSNPPDVDRPRRYHHSRTPSVASFASQADRNGLRSVHTHFDGGVPNVQAKKNMKFVNPYNNNGNDGSQADDDGRGTARSNVGSARGTTRHHHHHGRWGRNNHNNPPPLFDTESPFTGASRAKFSSNNSRQPSNPPSPRLNTSRTWLPGNKRQMALSNGYDMEDATPGADDERTPLLQTGTVRTNRPNRNRRNMHARNVESQTYYQNPSFLNRFASCLVLTVMVLLVVTGGIGFMFATSQPLTDVALLKIGNVLASEQELMFDITVQAHNPNVVVVMVDSADIEVFAKSRHAGNDSEWWRHPHGDDLIALDDPMEDPPDVNEPGDTTSPNMRLGNVHSFVSPLTYEGSFFQRGSTTSSGELRLSHPGNSTDSGTERWERIIADEFTLVIRGVLKYTLPLSQKVRKAPISGKTIVKPNSANDPTVQPSKPEVSISDKSTT